MLLGRTNFQSFPLPEKEGYNERVLAVGRKAWLFAGSDRGGERAAAIYTLIVTAKLNGLDPRAWLADVLRRINDHPASSLNELLPWHWRTTAMTDAQAA